MLRLVAKVGKARAGSGNSHGRQPGLTSETGDTQGPRVAGGVEVNDPHKKQLGRIRHSKIQSVSRHFRGDAEPGECLRFSDVGRFKHVVASLVFELELDVIRGRATNKRVPLEDKILSRVDS